MNPKFAEVVVDVHARDVDRPFDYRIPPELAARVGVGTRLIVPFGNRRVEGYVVGLSDEADVEAEKLKEILDVLDEQPPLTEELVQLSEWMSHQYLSGKAAAVQALLPAGMRAKTAVRLRLADKRGPEAAQSGGNEKSRFFEKKQELLRLLSGNSPVYKEQLLKERPDLKTVVQRLIQDGRVIESHEITQAVQTRYVTVADCPLSENDFVQAIEQIPARAFKQKEVLQWIRQNGPTAVRDVLRATQTTYAVIRALSNKGWIRLEQVEERRDPYADRFSSELEKPLVLTEEQTNAFDSIVESMRSGKACQILLQGVTGSGKTEIYLQSIAACTKQGKQAIVLVPEIALTPQMVERFKLRFGDAVAVLHSGLSQGERYDEWKRIRRGEVSIAVGARSAVFAPFEQIGLIVIDEEHELSYKQEDQPKYHAREVAWQRALHHSATLLLGSATPSLESRYAADRGEARHIVLASRFNKNALPQVQIIDMREELKAANRSMFSRELQRLIYDRLQKKEQTILFLNRRGHSTFILCRSCGYVARCPNCDISLTYHESGQFEMLRCHYCGHSESSVTLCPSCSSPHIRNFGTGTQRVEQELNKLFPNARVIRMDVDTTGKKGSHEQLLQKFREGQADILLGTQMIAKGLDFPRVSLVGAVSADTSLHLPDFRSAERTFQLLTQVAGRAGRHDTEGRVLIQTYQPEHYAIQSAAKQDYEDFYRQEIKIRQMLGNPPLCKQIVFTAQHEKKETAERWIRNLEKELCGSLRSPHADVLPACPAPLSKLQGKYRYHLTLKCSDYSKVQPVLSAIYPVYAKRMKEEAGLLTVDVNAQIIL
ncbi:primosomal protein N' [Effusibacillus dendaii]|uniref:Replication restart protein PriA n=1 Tax=Effusibacillus dendaii TaxID=2743772 RepID=A0A7I8D6W0_9BACL|nr:primosomal protein N' [Effusibacillus dendaii]BCJ85122.1 primosomal protein N' [Effusibacillus dendaii]